MTPCKYLGSKRQISNARYAWKNVMRLVKRSRAAIGAYRVGGITATVARSRNKKAACTASGRQQSGDVGRLHRQTTNLRAAEMSMTPFDPEGEPLIVTRDHIRTSCAARAG